MQKQQKAPETKYEKTIRRRGILLIVAALVIAEVFCVGGILLGNRLSAEFLAYAAALYLLTVVLPLLGIGCNILLRKRYVSWLNDMQVSEQQRFLLEHKEKAAEMSEDSLKKLRRLRRLTDGVAVLWVVLGLAAAFFGGVLRSVEWGTVVVFHAAIVILCGLSQIRFPQPKVLFSEDMSYLNPENYPELFALARKAADAVGCKGHIEIGINGDFNGGIGRIGNTYSVRLGVLLLNLLSAEELYAVLLHEFGHMVAENAEADREKTYHNWLINGRTNHVLSWLVGLSYAYLDTMYSFRMFLYEYACSVQCETAADRAMAEYADRAYAASALLKMKYYDLFDWEDGTKDETAFYAPEEPPAHVFADQINRFRAAIDRRAEDWNGLVDCEIPSRNATHPTLKMRMSELGISEYRIAESEDSPAFREECVRILQKTEERVCEHGADDYKAKRLEAYTKPAARVAEWEAAGKPLISVEYADMVSDLRSVGRMKDALELCERAINELDTAASCHAYFMRGLYRLHCYDPEGMDDLYHAMENNSNYIDEGLDAIGQFCCLTGRQEELDIYRERAVAIGQHQRDVYSEMNVLRKKDRLVSEQLTEELMTGLLETLRALDEEQLQSVYLVRKVITDDFFVSAVVVRFAKGVSDELRRETMHRLFRWLDTCSDWQFTLFDYEEVKKVGVESIPDAMIYPIAKEL